MDNRHVVLNREQNHIIFFPRYYRLIVDKNVHGYVHKQNSL